MSQLLCFIFPIIVHKLLRNISYCIGVRNINIIRYSFVGCRRRCANSQCCLINIIVIISISIIVVLLLSLCLSLLSLCSSLSLLLLLVLLVLLLLLSLLCVFLWLLKHNADKVFAVSGLRSLR